MSAITTHILDTANGRPASNVPVILDFEVDGVFTRLADGITDPDGRIKDLLSDEHKLIAGVYRIRFATAKYFKDINQKTFYPEVSVVFEIAQTDEHYHVPLLLNGFGYSTYRGS